MQRLKRSHTACFCILMCFRYGSTNSFGKYLEDFQSVYSSENYVPEDYISTVKDSDQSQKDRTGEIKKSNTVRWPPEDEEDIDEESKKDHNILGGIYDYSITDQFRWYGGDGETNRKFTGEKQGKEISKRILEPESWEEDEEWVRNEDPPHKNEDPSERYVESLEATGGDCEIKYFYDIDLDSTICRMEKEGCHLEYEDFRTVIPDKKRCVEESHRCVLKKEYKRVMLPFAKLGCQRYRKNLRMSKGNDLKSGGNICEFHYFDEIKSKELTCEMKQGECFLSDGKMITIIGDEENCRLKNDTCAPSRDFKTDLPFVSKKCRDFDKSPKIRKRRYSGSYPGYDCQLRMFQGLEMYAVVKCSFWQGTCFLEADNAITVAPDNGNCILYGDTCYVSTPFRGTNIPLVDKTCVVLDGFIQGHSNVQNEESLYAHPLIETTYNDPSIMSGRAGYDFALESRELRDDIEDSREPVGRSRNDLSYEQPRADLPRSSKGDIFSNSKYTSCVLLVSKKRGKVEKKCYPGNDETDVFYDHGKNCRMIEGQCFKVRRDPDFLKSYFSTPQNNILRCVILGEECFMLDGDMLLYKQEDCFEPVCRSLAEIPGNPGSYCDSLGCDDTDDFPVWDENSEDAGRINEDVPVKILDNNLVSSLSEGLKQISTKNHTKGKPMGIFYSVSYIYNDSVSSVFTSPNGTDKGEKPSTDVSDNVEVGGNDEKKEDENAETGIGVGNYEDDVEEDEDDSRMHYDDYDYEDFEFRSSRKSEGNDPLSADIWRDPKYTECIFHLTMRKNKWATKCYPGNEDTDEISPEHAHNCCLIDGECFKVLKDAKFLSSYFRKPPNRILPCVIIGDDCFLKDGNLLLFNMNDCYDSYCEKLASDPKISGNYCDSSKCGYSNPNLVIFENVNNAKRSQLGKSMKLRKLDDEIVSPLLNTLKAVVPKTDFEGEPSAVLYSIGLLYNDSESKSTKVRKVGEISRRTSSLPLPEGKAGESVISNSTAYVQEDNKISRRNNETMEIESSISSSKRKANESEINNSTGEVIDVLENNGISRRKNETIQIESSMSSSERKANESESSNSRKEVIDDTEDKAISRRKNETSEIESSISSPERKANGAEITNSTGEVIDALEESEISRRNNDTILKKSSISSPKQKFNEIETSNSTAIDGNSNERQFAVSLRGLGRSARNGPSDEKYQFVESKESVSNPALPDSRHRGQDKNAKYGKYTRGGKLSGSENREKQKTGKSNYFMHYLPVPIESESDRGVNPQARFVNDKGNNPNRRNGRSGSDKEYFFNPDFPFTFLGSYPGTTGFNDTLIMHENSYISHDEKVPRVQEISTRTVHFHDGFGPYDVDKDEILNFLANFPWPGWCIPETGEKKVGICCENHEKCRDSIEPSEKKFGLKNDSHYKRLHCECEFNFFKCLKGNGDILSNSLGIAYFNILAPKCFSLENRIFCLSRNKWKKCVKYGYEEKSKKGFQWLDTPTY